MKKPDKIMLLLQEMAQNMNECGSTFCNYEISSKADLNSFAEKIKEIEKKGDNILHSLTIELNKAFITPLDHEDILVLADKIDDVVDSIEEVVTYYNMYELVEADEYTRAFRNGIGANTKELLEAINLLVEKQLTKIADHIFNVKTNEEACDLTERKAIRELFQNNTNPIKIIQYKDIYEMLEGTVDATEKVAKALDIIVMKNL